MTLLSEVKVSSAPAVEPVSLSDAKAYMKVDYTDDDTMIEDVLIPSARQMVEKNMNRSLITQTLKAYYSTYDQKVMLPYSPIQSVTTVKRIDLNTITTLTVNNDFYVQGLDDKYLLMTSPYNLPPGHSPNDTLKGSQLEVEYVAGYGAAATDVPGIIREAIFKTIAFNYENRNEDEAGMELPKSAVRLINAYRKWQI